LGILKSTDGGQTWEIFDKDNGLRHLYLGSLFMHPDNPDILLAAAGHIHEPDTLPYLQALEGNDDPGPMGIYRTTDGGQTWTQVLPSYEIFSSVEMCPSNPNIVYASSDKSIHRSEDAGETWTLIAKPWGPPSVAVGFPIDMQCDPRDVNRIFVNNYAGGNYLSEDGGETWINASQGYTGAQIFDISIVPTSPERIYAASFGGLWRSDNGGGNWQGLFNPPENMNNLPSQGIAVDPTNIDHALAAKFEIVETFDGGNTWTERWSMQDLIDQGVSQDLISPAAPVIVFAPSDVNTVYVGFGHENCLLYHENECDSTPIGILLSNDGGTSWSLSEDNQISQLNIYDISVDYNNASHAYAATEAGLYESLNTGVNWSLVTGNLGNKEVHAIAINPSDPQEIFVSVHRDGIYHSSDGGGSWQHSVAGLEANSSIHDIVFDPTNSDNIFASDIYSGVYMSSDGGGMWIKINEGLQSRAARSLAISADGQHLYVGTNEDGAQRLDLSGNPLHIDSYNVNDPKLQDVFLAQNFPNPFNPSTTISFALLKDSEITISVYDVRGRLIKTLLNQSMTKGSTTINWDGKDNVGNSVKGGVYFYILQTNGFYQTKKMILLK